MVNRRIAAAVLLQDFHRAHPAVELDVVTMDAPVDAAMTAVAAGTVDATFHAVTRAPLPAGISAARVIDEPHQILVGPRHALAGARSVTPAMLAGHRIWMPGMLPGSEWSAYYLALAAAFGLTIDMVGPVFGSEALLAEIAAEPDLATLVGEGSRYLWPDSYGLRRIPVRDPAPIYPMSVIWRTGNPHPGLAALLGYLASRRTAAPDGCWTPDWPLGRPAAV